MKFQLSEEAIKKGNTRAAEIFGLLKEQGWTDDEEEEILQYALVVLCLSAFYNRVSFAHVVHIMSMMWFVWEDNSVNPKEVANEIIFGPKLRNWEPPGGGKVS